MKRRQNSIVRTMHAYCGGIGIALHLASVVLLGYVLVSSAWTTATVRREAEPVLLKFAPSQLCIDNVCSSYAAAFVSESTSNRDNRLQQDVLNAFCGISMPSQSTGLFDVVARAAEQDICIAAMETCRALLIVLFTLALLSTGGITLCLTYWTHEHQVGRVLLAALVVSAVLHGVIVLFWAQYATPTFPPSTFSHGSVEDVTMNAPTWVLVFNGCVVLMASMTFTHLVIVDQRRRYLNRRHVCQIDKHPLECPAMYA